MSATDWRTVYVFISSTFSDMHAERDYLVKQVFPRVRDWCELRKLRLVDVDLRWGLTESDTAGLSVVRKCLANIDRCRPFFLCLVGQRYGWIPTVGDVSSDTRADYPGLAAELERERSITDLEIRHALVSPLNSGAESGDGPDFDSEQAFFYLRDPSYLTDLPADPQQLLCSYTDVEPARRLPDGTLEMPESPLGRQELPAVYADASREAGESELDGFIGLDDLPESVRTALVGPGAASAERDPAVRLRKLRKLRELRSRLIPSTGRPVRRYTAEWFLGGGLRTPELALPLECPFIHEENIELWRRQWFDAAGVVIPPGELSVPEAQLDAAESYNERLTAGRLGRFRSDGRTLADVVFDDLTRAISKRHPERARVVEESELEKEIGQHEEFVLSSHEGFVGRDRELRVLDDYVNGASDKAFVLTASAGMGKSTLIGEWVHRRRRDAGAPEDELVRARFAGVGDRATSIDGVIRSVVRELHEIDGRLPDTVEKKVAGSGGVPEVAEVPLSIPADRTGLLDSWPEMLSLAGRAGPTIVVVDALNQLDGGLSDLDWIPDQLPEGAKLVVSFKCRPDDDVACAAQERLEKAGHHVCRLGPLEDPEERKALARGQLEPYLKELDDDQMDALVRSRGASSPLFLKIVLSELRVFGSYASLREKIDSDFGDTPESAFDAVLRRLEGDQLELPDGARVDDTVCAVFSLLAHARGGLSGVELGEVARAALGLGPGSRDELRSGIELLLRQVRPFLARRNLRHDFFYESMRDAVASRYTTGEEVRATRERPPGRSRTEWHRLLARYFDRLPLWCPPDGDGAPEAPTPDVGFVDFESAPAPMPRGRAPDSAAGICRRKTEVLPYHLVRAGEWDRLDAVLTNPEFLEAKVRVGLVDELQDDLRTALEGIPGAEEAGLAEEERRRVLADYARDVALHAAGELEPPPFIESVPPRSDARMDEEAERMASDPTAAERMRSVAQFVLGHAPHFVQYGSIPRFVAQQAHHAAPLDFLRESAEGALAEDDGATVFEVAPGSKLPPDTNPACLMTLRGHELFVNSVAYGLDGRRIVSGGSDGTLRVWDVDTGRCRAVLKGHDGYVTSVALLHDGRMALSGGIDRKVNLWDLEARRLVRTFRGHEESLYAVDFLLGGRLAVSGSSGEDDRSIRLWDVQSGQCVGTLDRENTYGAICFRPTLSGRQLVVGSYNGDIGTWDVESRELLSSFWIEINEYDRNAVGRFMDAGPGPHWRGGLALSEDPGGRRALFSLGRCSPTIHVLDLDREECVGTLTGPGGDVMSVALSRDGRWAVSGGLDGGVTLWDVDEMRPVRTFKGHAEKVHVVCLSADGRRAVSSSNDSTVRVWDVERGRSPEGAGVHSCIVGSVAIGPLGKHAVSRADNFTYDGYVEDPPRIWDVATGSLVRELEDALRSTSLPPPEFGPDGSTVIMRDPLRGLVYSWDVATGKRLPDSGPNQSEAPGGFCRELGLVVRRRIDDEAFGPLEVRDAKSNECVRELGGSAGVGPAPVSVSEDGRLAVSFELAEVVFVWDTTTGEMVRTLEHGIHGKVQVGFDGSGRLAIARADDEVVELWDTTTWERAGALEGHAARGFMEKLKGGAGGYEVTDMGGGYSRLVYHGNLAKVVETLKTRPGDSRGPVAFGSLRGVTVPTGTLRGVTVPTGTPRGSADVDERHDRAAASGTRWRIAIWDIASGERVQSIDDYVNSEHAPWVGAAGKHVYQRDGRSLCVWDRARGVRTATLDLDCPEDEVPLFHVAPDESTCWGRAPGDVVHVWRLPDGELVRRIEETKDRRHLGGGRSGRWVTSRVETNGVRLWDAESGTQVAELEDCPFEIESAYVSADGRCVLVRGDRQFALPVLLWDTRTGDRQYFPLDDGVSAVEIGPDSRSVCFGTRGGRVILAKIRGPESS